MNNSIHVMLTLVLLATAVLTYGASVDDVENLLSADDLRMIESLDSPDSASPTDGSLTWRFSNSDPTNVSGDGNGTSISNVTVPTEVDCFGLGFLARKVRWMFNLRPQSAQEVNVRFYLKTRNQRVQVEIPTENQFGLEWTDFSPSRRTVMIVHGFLSHGNASWVRELTDALLGWEAKANQDKDEAERDVNVIAVDWSAGGSTWKYWRAVANTRRVGADITSFLKQLFNATGATAGSLHMVGHSLGAHICSYAAAHLGGVDRITGLDPAQPCFRTQDTAMLLDSTDAKFVDVIHTNGRMQSLLGLGLPEPCGHVDFFPNGGMKQPGCFTGKKKSFFSKILPISKSKLENAICSHGRAYMYFIESLMSRNCSFLGYKWNMTYYGAVRAIEQSCTRDSCSVMGIAADVGPARGEFYVVTRDQTPFCVGNPQRTGVAKFLFSDFFHGKLYRNRHTTKPPKEVATTKPPKVVATTKPPKVAVTPSNDFVFPNLDNEVD